MEKKGTTEEAKEERWLKAGERLDETGFGDLAVIQKPSEFCYGVDAVLLAGFAAKGIKEGARVADLGTGTGILPLILSHKTKAALFWGVEIQEAAYDRARRTAAYNGLAQRLRYFHGNVTEAAQTLGVGAFDAVVTNPPYTEGGAGMQSENRAKMIARHEIHATLEDFIQAAAQLLKHRGDLYVIHRPNRLTDLLCSARNQGLEPKELCFISPNRKEIPNLLLLHCVKGAGAELRMLPSLFIYDEDGGYTRELLEIYERYEP